MKYLIIKIYFVIRAIIFNCCYKNDLKMHVIKKKKILAFFLKSCITREAWSSLALEASDVPSLVEDMAVCDLHLFLDLVLSSCS